MRVSSKSFIIFIISGLLGLLCQLQLMDTESALNTEYITDIDYDYDRNGQTAESHSVDGLVKLPQVILFLENL